MLPSFKAPTVRLLSVRLLSVWLLALSFGCGDDASFGVDSGTGEAGPDAAASSLVASCTYTNSFSSREECKEYRAGEWTEESVAADCARVFLTLPGELTLDQACELPNEIGRCRVGDRETDGYVIVSTGDASACGATQAGCENFIGGTFEGGAICETCETGMEVTQAFTPAYLDCRPALEGEPAGTSDGEVCTWTVISASTEPGRRYADYADCAAVRTQRPYFPIDGGIEPAPADDPRLADADYMRELAWVTEEAEASACACCHTASDTPAGASVWDTEAGELWVDTVSDKALAMLGGFTDSAAFGYLPTAENNEFDRSETGLPTTDRNRLRAFVVTELNRRGVSESEAGELDPFAPFFRELIDYEPEACEEGVGVDAAGELRWTGGGARYIHVLAAGSKAPGVPPNWDLPEGTLWAISVAPDQPSLGCGMLYGTVPEGASQRLPEEGEAPALVTGETYFLYVQRDVILPIERCLFQAP